MFTKRWSVRSTYHIQPVHQRANHNAAYADHMELAYAIVRPLLSYSDDYTTNLNT